MHGGGSLEPIPVDLETTPWTGRRLVYHYTISDSGRILMTLESLLVQRDSDTRYRGALSLRWYHIEANIATYSSKKKCVYHTNVYLHQTRVPQVAINSSIFPASLEARGGDGWIDGGARRGGKGGKGANIAVNQTSDAKKKK